MHNMRTRSFYRITFSLSCASSACGFVAPFLSGWRLIESTLFSRVHDAVVHDENEASSTSTTTTNVTLVLPRFSNSNEGFYPSPLHIIHVTTLLDHQEAANCWKLAQDYAAATGCWDKPDFTRHASYATCDFALEECDSLVEYLQEIDFDARLLGELGSRFGIPPEELSYLDIFFSHYETRSESKPDVMDHLEAHRDGSLLSFTILLTSPEKFSGGGTFFDALRDAEPAPCLFPGGVVRPPLAGDAVLMSGKILHGSDVVTSGERTILVGFVEVPEWWQRSGALSRACRDWGRSDVAAFRYKRQQAKTEGGRKGWLLKNHHLRPEGIVRSDLRGYCPVFPTVAQRAEAEYQRLKKLEAEDVLLRTILLEEPVVSFDGPFEIFENGDITVL